MAGGILTEEDVTNALKLGADGVQVASRFVTTKECDASMAFKKAYLQAEKEDTVIIKSPVGMPGRAIRNPFVERMQAGKETISGCYQCLPPHRPLLHHPGADSRRTRAGGSRPDFLRSQGGGIESHYHRKRSDPGVRVWKTAERAAAYIANEKGSIRMKTWKITAVLTGAALVIGGIAATVWGCVKKFPAPAKGPETPTVSGDEEAKTEDQSPAESQASNLGDF